jgi:hypothetical protein
LVGDGVALIVGVGGDGQLVERNDGGDTTTEASLSVTRSQDGTLF